MEIFFSYQYLVLLTYTPRKDVNFKEYEEWLIEVDNPFFNSINEVAHYSNWKVLENPQNSKFLYFDFLTFSSLSDFNKAWNSKELNAFTRQWRKLWGQAPESNDLSLNARVFLFENIGIKSNKFSNLVSIEFQNKYNKINNCNWKLVKSLRDEVDFNYLKTEFLKTKPLSAVNLIGRLIASP